MRIPRHPRLLRQLDQLGIADGLPNSEAFHALLELVDRAYSESDRDRYTSERALTVSTEEMSDLQQRLSEERDRLDVVIRVHSEGLVYLDGDDRVQLLNPAAERMLGVPAVRACGRCFVEIVDIKPMPVFFTEAWRTVGQRLRDDRCVFGLQGGESFPAAYVITPLLKSGVLLGSVIGFRDRSEAQRDEERLQSARLRVEVATAAERAKTDFLAHMSHELRTPLTAILGYSEMLIEEAEQGSEQAQDLGHIRTAGSHLLRLINEVLDLARIEAGRMAIEPEKVDVDALVREVIGTLRPLVSAQTQLTVASNAGWAWVDPTRLRQCLLNLLGNAVKFTPQGQVSLRVWREQGWLHCEVVDTGVGIPADQLSRVFEAFHQVDTSTTRSFGGSGLGLALVRKVVRLMGGTVCAESVPGEGSTFRLDLPVDKVVRDSGSDGAQGRE